MPYAFREITINNRSVLLDTIIEKKSVPETTFEKETFSFIHDWLTGVESFNLFTSGSTGTPKEIFLTRNQLLQSARRTLSAIHLIPGETALVCLDTKYIAGKMMLARALEGGLKIVAVEPSSNPLRIIDEVINFIALVPLQLQEILIDVTTRRKINSISKIIIGGAAINSALKKEIENLSIEVYATYGMTETVSHIALQRLNGNNKSDYFEVLNGITIEQDKRGCLIIHVPEFKEAIITNDVVNVISPRQFQWVGRWDTIINSGGYKISPENLEEKIQPVVAEFSPHPHYFIGSLPDEKLGQKLILVMEHAPWEPAREAVLLQTLKQVLHPYEVPKQICYSSSFIRTATGKINRPETLKSLLPDGRK